MKIEKKVKASPRGEKIKGNNFLSKYVFKTKSSLNNNENLQKDCSNNLESINSKSFNTFSLLVIEFNYEVLLPVFL